MGRSDMTPAAAAYLDRVEELLSDVDEEERLSLLADLADQLDELSEFELTNRLGTPEEFAAEYRRSAGLQPPPHHPDPPSRAVISALALPLGVVALFSFGGQLVFGPFLLAIEWILARISPTPLRLAWSLLAAALAGEIAYLAVDLHVPQVEGFLAVVIGLTTAALTATLFHHTTRET